MSRIILRKMEDKGVSSSELREAHEDLKEFKEKHGEAGNIAMLFEADAIESILP